MTPLSQKRVLAIMTIKSSTKSTRKAALDQTRRTRKKKVKTHKDTRKRRFCNQPPGSHLTTRAPTRQLQLWRIKFKRVSMTAMTVTMALGTTSTTISIDTHNHLIMPASYLSHFVSLHLEVYLKHTNIPLLDKQANLMKSWILGFWGFGEIGRAHV